MKVYVASEESGRLLLSVEYYGISDELAMQESQCIRDQVSDFAVQYEAGPIRVLVGTEELERYNVEKMNMDFLVHPRYERYRNKNKRIGAMVPVDTDGESNGTEDNLSDKELEDLGAVLVYDLPDFIAP
jgi:hypothetical protein